MLHTYMFYEFQVIFCLIFHLFAVPLVVEHYLCTTSATKVQYSVVIWPQAHKSKEEIFFPGWKSKKKKKEKLEQ